MKKIFTLAAAVLASFSLWAETVTFTAAEIKAGTAKSGITPYFDANPANKNLCKDGETQNKADVCEVKNSSDTILVSSLKEQAQVLFTANEKYITKIVVNGATNSTGSGAVKNIPALYWKGNAITESFDGAELVSFSGYDVACENAYYTFQNMPEKTQIAGIFRRVKVDNATNPTKKVNKSGVNFGDGQTFYVASVEITYENACTDPEAHLAFNKSTAFVGEQFTYDYGSLNGGALNTTYTLDGVPAVENTDYTFTSGNLTVLKAGQFVMHRTVDAENGYCAVDVSDTILINAANPVTAVTIDGPAAGFVGQELTYTATAEGATAYQWLVDGVDANTNAATFKYTAVKGNHSIVCKARNEFNAEDDWIASDPIALTVTKLCGELIKVSATAYNAATATGIFSGTTSASMSSKDSEKSVYEDLTGYKLNTKNTHLGITFNAGQTLQAGDVVTVFVTTVSAKLQLFADKGTTLIGETDNVVQGENQIILGSAANGANGIYVYRTEAAGADMNPFVAYVSVTRPCEESDNNIASVTINGEAAEKSGTVFNYTLSASYAESTVAVEITLEHPLATLMEEHAASFTMPTPEVGTPSVETFKVKAENGEQAWYSIFVNKAASLNNDATLKALSVEGFELTPAFDPAVVEYSITKAYEAALPATTTVTAETNDANATFNVAYNELVENEILVQVLAEDGETANTYSIKVYSAEAIKSLSRVLFSNGFDAFIDNTNRTVKAFYLDGTEAPTATTITAGAGTAGEIADGKIVVTGADESLAEYVVTLEAVAANTNVVEETAEAGAFDGTEAWVKAGLYMGNAAGFNAGKYVLRRQLKGSDAADDQRVIAGWVRAYFFVGNASKLELANTANKKVKYAIDGGEYTESEAEQLVIELEAGNHMIEIVTNQSSGDCNLSAPKLVKRTATGIENAEAEMKAVKIIRDGQVLILRDGKIFNALGAEVK